MKMYNPPHPGLLVKEYLEEGLSVTEMAKRLGVSRVALSRVINGKAAVSPEMAIRLSLLLPNTTPKLWLGMQAAYDLWQVEQRQQFNILPLASFSSTYAAL